MKIKPEDFKTLKEAMDETINKYPKAMDDYKSKGLSKKRFAWDVLHCSEITGYNSSTQFVCDRLYKYLNDNHIDTAVLRIIGTY